MLLVRRPIRIGGARFNRRILLQAGLEFVDDLEHRVCFVGAYVTFLLVAGRCERVRKGPTGGSGV